MLKSSMNKLFTETTSNILYTSKSKSIETGRIEKGNYSNQKFQTVYNDFEYFKQS